MCGPLSRDSQEAERYRMREKSLADKYNALLGAEARGKALGEARGKATGERNKALEVAKNILSIMPNDEIAKHTGLAISEIEALR